LANISGDLEVFFVNGFSFTIFLQALSKAATKAASLANAFFTRSLNCSQT